MSDATREELKKAMAAFDMKLNEETCWKHAQSGKWIIKHTYCEKLAAKAGVIYDDPVTIEADMANGIAVVLVRGRLGKKEEWAYGEASPKNCKLPYPFSMAEKRAKDKVILKLIGLHGLVYSEAEADDFKDTRVEYHEGESPDFSNFNKETA